MDVLVTGGAGFIGSHLTERLLAAGHAVRVLDDLSTGKRENLPQHPALELCIGDVRNARDVRAALSGCRAVVHLAAIASVQASVDEPVGTHAANFLGTLNLLEAARYGGVRRFLYASSAAVYGDAAPPVAETAPLNPLSPYAADKLAGEHYLGFYARAYGIESTAFRFFNVYGPRQDPGSPYSGVISIFAELARAGRAVTIYGDGSQTRDFVYVTDLVEVLARALDGPRSTGKVVNIGRGVECSLLTLLDELERVLGGPIERRYQAARVGDIRRSCADVSRLQSLHGGVPQTSLAVGLARLLNEHWEVPSPQRTQLSSQDGVRV